MKNDAQAILLAGYLLEPMVALQVNKTYQSHIQATFGAALPQAQVVPTASNVAANQALRA